MEKRMFRSTHLHGVFSLPLWREEDGVGFSPRSEAVGGGVGNVEAGGAAHREGGGGGGVLHMGETS